MNGSTLKVRVERKSVEAVDICTFELVSADGEPLPAFAAGSHIDVHVPGGITRQYSLCNDPAESHRYLIGVLKDSVTRGGSKAMHEQVSVGDLIEISAPKNHFPLAHEAKNSLLLAGGIGVAPILCMAERLAIAGAAFEMHYCTRSKDCTAFHDRSRRSGFSSRVHFHFEMVRPIRNSTWRQLWRIPAHRDAPLRVRPEGLHGPGAVPGAGGNKAVRGTTWNSPGRFDWQRMLDPAVSSRRSTSICGTCADFWRFASTAASVRRPWR